MVHRILNACIVKRGEKENFSENSNLNLNNSQLPINAAQDVSPLARVIEELNQTTAALRVRRSTGDEEEEEVVQSKASLVMTSSL